MTNYFVRPTSEPSKPAYMECSAHANIDAHMFT